LQLQNVAHNTHCTQQNNQCLLNKTAVFQSWVLKLRIAIQNIINDKCYILSVLHLQPHTLEVFFATLQLLYQ